MSQGHTEGDEDRSIHDRVLSAGRNVDAARYTQLFLDWQRGRQREWYGKALCDTTVVRPLEISDIEGPRGVRESYQASLIADELILALRNGTFAQKQEELKERGLLRGGMLHDFDTPPVAPYKFTKSHSTPESVHDEMVRRLRHAQLKSLPGKSSPSLYEGSVLAPKTAPRPILAWSTWLRSRIANPDKRRFENDDYIKEIIDVIQSIELYRGDHEDYTDKADTTLLFDTLNGAVPGGASVLWSQKVPQWIEQGYSRILLYRHKMLEIFAEDGREVTDDDTTIPRGNNEESEEFFKKRRLVEIGTRAREEFARRIVNVDGNLKTFLIRSIEGWMYGDTNEVKEASNRADAAERKKYFVT